MVLVLIYHLVSEAHIIASEALLLGLWNVGSIGSVHSSQQFNISQLTTSSSSKIFPTSGSGSDTNTATNGIP